MADRPGPAVEAHTGYHSPVNGDGLCRSRGDGAMIRTSQGVYGVRCAEGGRVSRAALRRPASGAMLVVMPTDRAVKCRDRDARRWRSARAAATARCSGNPTPPPSSGPGSPTTSAGWRRPGRVAPSGGYEELWQWSVAEPGRFWASIWDYFDVLGPAAVTGPVLAGGPMPDVTWFAGSHAELRAERAADRLHRSRTGSAVSYRLRGRPRGAAQLRRARRGGRRCAARGLRALGVGRGDRVAAYLPNVPEALIGLLADGEPGRDLVVLLAGLRRAQRDRPVRPDRPEGADRACDGYGYGGQAVRPAARGRRDRGRAARPGRRWSSSATWSWRRPDRRLPGRPGRHPAARLGGPRRPVRDRRRRSWSSTRCRSRTRCGCSTPRAPPGCPSRSCTVTAASCWST